MQHRTISGRLPWVESQADAKREDPWLRLLVAVIERARKDVDARPRNGGSEAAPTGDDKCDAEAFLGWCLAELAESLERDPFA